MLESLNGSAPALQADSHGIQIHGAPAPPYIFNCCRPGRVVCATRTNVFIGRAFLFGPLTESTHLHVYVGFTVILRVFQAWYCEKKL